MEQSGSLEQHLLGLELHLLDPTTRKDATAVAALLTDDFVEYGSSGRVFLLFKLPAGGAYLWKSRGDAEQMYTAEW